LRKADLGIQEFRRAGSSVKAATLQIFRVFRAFRGQKMGCGRQPTPSLFVWFVVKKWLRQAMQDQERHRSLAFYEAIRLQGKVGDKMRGDQ